MIVPLQSGSLLDGVDRELQLASASQWWYHVPAALVINDNHSELVELPSSSLHFALFAACMLICLKKDSLTRNLDALDMHHPGGQALTLPIDRCTT